MKKIKNDIYKLHEKLFSSRFEMNPGIKYFSLKDFPCLKSEKYELKNKNGFVLRGAIFHYDNCYPKDKIVVFCPGYSEGYEAYLLEINFLAQSGFSVLAVDYQGVINSDGDKMNCASQAVSDMDDVIHDIKNKFKHIYAIGHSWGGWVAACISILNECVEKVVMLAAMESNKICIERFVKKHKYLSRFPFMKIERTIYPQYADLRCRDVTKRKNLSGLIMQSIDDKILDINKHLRIIKKHNKNPNFKFLELNGKNHMPTYTKESVDALVNYYKRIDKIGDKKKLIELANSQDWHSLRILDTKIMNEIVNFLKQ